MNLNTFFNTALGNAVKVAIYQAGAAVVAAYAVGGFTAKQLVAVGLTAAANTLLVFFKGVVSPTTPTFPGSAVQPPVAGAPVAPTK